jgi:UDP-glucuronate decarboxylase
MMDQDELLRRRPDISLAKAKLRWEPTIPLRDGLIRTIDYFRSHLGVLLK